MDQPKHIGFFDAAPNNRSSSRLTSFIVVMAALSMSEQVLIFAYINGTDILLAAASAGTTFVTIGGASMYYMYNQKKQEKQETPTGAEHGQ